MFRNTLRNPFSKKKIIKFDEAPLQNMEVVYENDEICVSSSFLFKACEIGNINKIETILNLKPDWVNLKNKDGDSSIHLAVKNKQIDVIRCLIKHNADLDEKDGKDNTALLLSVEIENHEILNLLLKHKANPNNKNTLGISPLNKAIELNNIEIVKSLLNDEQIDVNIRDNIGGTPLHKAAEKDYVDIAKILLEAGAKNENACNAGITPTHAATLNNSTGVMLLLVQHAEKQNSIKDSNSCPSKTYKLPLHEAVNTGNYQSVKMCISAGACIDTKQPNGETAVHIAASRSCIEILDFLLKSQPDKKKMVLTSKDSTLMTPLHKAAVFDRPDIIEYLVNEGSNVNDKDIDGMTPVLLSASKKSWKALEKLMEVGADMFLTDDAKRNVLHLIVLNGGHPEKMAFACCKEKVRKLLNESDSDGCTALHYASKTGNFKTIQSFIDMGALLNVKNHGRQSPLHFASRYGRYNSCKRLLESSKGVNILSELDNNGQTPLHLASYGGHSRIVELFLTTGASIQKDFKGNSPAHLASEAGFETTLKILLDWNSSLINAKNSDGDTCLHLSGINNQARCVDLLMSLGGEFLLNNKEEHFFDLIIINENKEAALSVIGNERWKESLRYSSSSKFFYCPEVGLIQYLPQVFKIVLEKCKIPNGLDRNHKDFHWKYNFEFLQIPLEIVRKLRKEKKGYTPLLTLNCMIKYNRVDLLSHPVCLAFLKMKWDSYGMWLHKISLFFYLCFLISLSTFVGTYDPIFHADEGLNVTDHTSSKWMNSSKPELKLYQRIFVFVIIIYSCVNILKEFGQMFQQKFKYFTDFTNVVEWTLYVTSLLFIIPFLKNSSYHWQWECASIAVFLAWVNLLLFLQSFDFFGIYVVMFMGILRTLIQVLIVFSILFIAFGFAFFILMSGESWPSHQSISISMLSVFVMMLGEINYLENWVVPFFDPDPYKMHFSHLSFIFLVAFILLIAILLMNLLIGLAVGDIESVQRNARLRRLAMQVDLFTNMERKMPQRFLEFVDKTEVDHYPNFSCKNIMKRISTFFNGDSDNDDINDHLDDIDENYRIVVFDELNRQKRKLDKISMALEKQFDFVRLIVQKMEIKSEEDGFDSDDDNDTNFHHSKAAVNISTTLKKASITNFWKNESKRIQQLKTSEK